MAAVLKIAGVQASEGSNPSLSFWSCSVVVNTSACHAEDRGFDPHQLRHAHMAEWQTHQT